MQPDQYPANIEIKREKIKIFCRNLETELIAACEEKRTLNVDIMHLKGPLISSGRITISITLPEDLEGGYISLEAGADNFKIHKDYDYPIIQD